MHSGLKSFKIYKLAIFLLVIIALWLAIGFISKTSCTIITAIHKDTVLFGNNEDWHSQDPVIGFYPVTDQGYGSFHIGFRRKNGSIEFGGAMNDQGLAWDVNSVPKSALKPHPEKPFSHETDNYLSTITKKAKTVEDAIQIAHDFDFGNSMSLQIHIADASGDAVVISAGPDEELAFTRKEFGDGYLVSTNFNLAIPEKRKRCWRYEKAKSMLNEVFESDNLSYEGMGEILEAVHLESLTSYTLYSNVFDLKDRKIHLYYLSQYNELISLNLDEELLKGQHIREMKDLFTPETVAAGQTDYRNFNLKFTIAKISFVGIILTLIAGGVVFIIKKLRMKRK